MVFSPVAFAPTLFVIAIFSIFFLNWTRHATWSRTIVCASVFALSIRYMVWRFTATVLPYPHDNTFGFYWVWTAFAIEVLAFSDIVLFLLVMARYADRSSEANRLQAELFSRPAEELPSVDIFIPTYNEPLDVLERTIVGALALDYPGKFTVYVLDDKRREWLRDFCQEKGARHVIRPDNTHAKAGNMNHGLEVSDGEFIAIFDADFVPYRNFLRRTVGFFLDPTIGIVQTPQHFFNKDPVQTNLSIERYWPDEQRLFFDEMAASRDAWDVSFCCGSCSIVRRAAVRAIGGFPTESITEDLLTTLAMLNKGFKTRYLNERLSMGLAAENLKGYFVQRGRWCRGGIQTLYLHNGPIRGPGLTLLQRILFLPLSWISQYLVRFTILIVPIVYLWTGAAPLYFTSTDDIASYQFPLLVSYFLLMFWLTPTRYLPVISSAVGTFSTFRMLPVVLSSLIKPFGVPFRVTPKGSGNEENQFDGYSFFCISALITLTALGLLINLLPELSSSHSDFSPVAFYWSAINIVVLLLAALICFEAPRPTSENFAADEPVEVSTPDRVFPAQAAMLSLDGARIEMLASVPVAVGDKVVLHMQQVSPLEAIVTDASPLRGGAKLCVSMLLPHVSGQARDELIVKLYTGSYSQDIPKLDRSEIIKGVWRRAFGHLPPHHPRSGQQAS